MAVCSTTFVCAPVCTVASRTLVWWLCAASLLLHPDPAKAATSPNLRAWIPRMQARNAHGGKLEDLASEHRVVVVMTTIPKRIDRIEPVLDSMLSQTWPIAALYLSIPYTYNRTGERYVIPAWLREKPGVSIVRCQDLGPGTHLLNGLRIERDPWAFLAVVDDDHIYSPRLVEDLMRSALAHPGSAIAAQGFLSIPGLELRKDSPRYLHDQGFSAGPVLVSYLGVVYQRGFFDDSVFDYSAVSPQCKYQDDMWFSAHLARKGIRRWVLGGAMGVQELRDMHLGPESLTFWDENKPRRVSEECNDSLLRLQGDIWSWRRRLVLSIGGLPPLIAENPAHSEAPSSSDSLASGADWKQVLELMKQLPRVPDLTYLCTKHSLTLRKSRGDSNNDEDDSRKDSVIGSSFLLDGVLVTASDACEAHVAEPKVGHLMRDALQWEGDPDTVVVMGSVGDIAADKDVAPVADCAAELFRAEEGLDKHERPQLELAGTALDAVPLPGSQTDTSSKSSGIADASAPFCRMGGLAAVSVGALTQRM